MRNCCAYATTAYAWDMSSESIEQIRTALAEVPAEPLAAVRSLAAVRVMLEAELDEAMAAAAMSGSSMRAVAREAGVAPNTVAPRMARSNVLAPYSGPAGRVSSSAIERARYDAETGRRPPKFQLRQR